MPIDKETYKKISEVSLDTPDLKRAERNLLKFFELNHEDKRFFPYLAEMGRLFAVSQFLANYCIAAPKELLTALKETKEHITKEMLLENWDKYEKLSIYFEGVVQMTRPFVDEAFAKVLETHSLDEFNQKLHFPDSNDRIVKSLNEAIKLRLKIIKTQKEREQQA